MRRVILLQWLGVAVASSVAVLYTGLFITTPFGAEGAANFSHLHQHIDAESGQGDGDEDSVQSCVATWTDLLNDVPIETEWSFATGTPPAQSFSLSADCQFDTETPVDTPLALPPPVWNVTVDDVVEAVLIASILPLTGEITFWNDVDAGSTVVIKFYFQPNQNPTPDPVPIPSLSSIYLAILAGLLVIVVTLRLNRSKLRKRI